MKGHARSSAGWAVFLGACLGLVLSGCASAPPEEDSAAVAAYQKANDPIEPLNRSIFKVNLALDRVVLKPVAFVYKEAVPAPVQSMVYNFLNNLRTPVILVNDLLQGEFGRAGNTLVRFMMNSGFGILGTSDIAAEFNIPKHDEDFGQTLASWGSGEGFYLMLPLVGPSNPRDALGRVVDFLFDPITYLYNNPFRYSQKFALAHVRTGAEAVDFRARRYDAINELEKSSLDYYAAVRSLYRQTRDDEIRNGRPAPLQPLAMNSWQWERKFGIQESHNRSVAD